VSAIVVTTGWKDKNMSQKTSTDSGDSADLEMTIKA